MRQYELVPPINLDRNSRVPLRRQIYRDIARAIRAGAISQEATLPASRKLAAILGVSRNTVVEAYDDLAADDLIRGKRGSGMRVNGTTQRGASSSWLMEIIQAAQYPQRVLSIADVDGNALYLKF